MVHPEAYLNKYVVVMMFADCQLDAVTVDPTGIVSDHALVVCRLTATNTTYLRLLQTISENSFIWRPKPIVTLLNL